MSTELSPENEKFIEQEVTSGVFEDRSQALDAGVELLKARKAFLDRIAESRRQLDNGEYTEYDDDSLRERFDQLKARAEKQLQEHRDGE